MRGKCDPADGKMEVRVQRRPKHDAVAARLELQRESLQQADASLARVDRSNRAGAARLDRERRAEAARQQRDAREEERQQIARALKEELPAHELLRKRLRWVSRNCARTAAVPELKRVQQDLEQTKLPHEHILGLRRAFIRAAKKLHGELRFPDIFTTKVLMAKFHASASSHEVEKTRRADEIEEWAAAQVR